MDTWASIKIHNELEESIQQYVIVGAIWSGGQYALMTPSLLLNYMEVIEPGHKFKILNLTCQVVEYLGGIDAWTIMRVGHKGKSK